MIDRKIRELSKEEIKETANTYHNWLKNENNANKNNLKGRERAFYDALTTDDKAA